MEHNQSVFFGTLQDFCYYANTFFLVMLLLFPKNEKLFMICFSFAEVITSIRNLPLHHLHGQKANLLYLQGPLAWALIVWRCSLVFSSVDKIVSVLIHLLPGELTHHLCLLIGCS